MKIIGRGRNPTVIFKEDYIAKISFSVYHMIKKAAELKSRSIHFFQFFKISCTAEVICSGSAYFSQVHLINLQSYLMSYNKGSSAIFLSHLLLHYNICLFFISEVYDFYYFTLF